MIRATPYRKIILQIIGVAIFSLTTLQGLAQSPHFRNHSLPTEFRDAETKVLFQEKQGYIWVGTTKGALRYDGFEYKPFLQRAEFGNDVSVFFEDDSSNLWIGYRSGRIAIVKDEKFISYNPEEGFPAVPITAFAQDKEKNIWYSTYGEGIYVRRYGRLYNINKHDGLNDNYVYSMTSDPAGRIIAGTDNGMAICEFDGTKKIIKHVTAAEGLPDNIVTVIRNADDGTLWLGTESMGICNYNPATGEFKSQTRAWAYGKVTDLIAWNDGVWIATSGKGIIETNKNGSMALPLRSANDPMARILNLMQDREGNIWVTNGTGTIYSTNRMFSFINTAPETRVQSLLYSATGNIFLSTGPSLYAIKPNGMSTKLEFDDPAMKNVNIISMYEDSVGFLWLGTFDKGVYRMDPKKHNVLHIGQEHGLVNNNILSIAGSGSDIWLGTLGGVTKLTYKQEKKEDPAAIKKPVAKKPARTRNQGPKQPDPKQFFDFTNYTSESGLGSNFIYKVFVDSKDRIWFGTDGKGITVFADQRFRNYTLSDAARNNIIYSITEDASGTIWLSTANNGLYRIQNEKFEPFTPQRGLRDLAISSIAADRRGNLVVVSKEGIDVIDPATGTIFYHDDEFGINSIDPDLNAVTSDNFGNIWIGTQRGIIRYREAAGLPVQPHVRINKVLLFLSETDTASAKKFRHDQNHISFNYIAFWYRNPDDISYQLRLDGYDNEWINSRNRFVTYPNLAPGDYTFKVRASATNDFKEADEVQYAFSILQPFYKRPWFYAATALAALAAIFLIIRFRERRLKQAEREQREKVQFQLETLKSQVNPHFLFNSFNTLASVIEEDRAGAIEYVEKLSDFYRNILLHRQQDLIPVSTELALIENYYFLQLKRYRKNFVLERNVPDTFHHKKIPPLTLQLLVENAVKHNIISTGQPLIVEIFVSNNEYLAVRNNLQRKTHHEPSTGIGLSNITHRFRILTDKPVHIKEDDEYFTVFIPLLD
jgi:ligand-binding sensor domain-containing protein